MTIIPPPNNVVYSEIKQNGCQATDRCSGEIGLIINNSANTEVVFCYASTPMLALISDGTGVYFTTALNEAEPVIIKDLNYSLYILS